MEILTTVYLISNFIATVVLIVKADEFNSIYDVILAPYTICRIVIGRARYLLFVQIIAIGIGISGFWAAAYIFVLVWLIVFALSLARVWSSSVVFTLCFGIFILVLPGIAIVVLAFLPKPPLISHVSLMWFLTGEGWRHD